MNGRLKTVVAAVILLIVLAVALVIWSTRSGDSVAGGKPGSTPSTSASPEETARQFSAKYLTTAPASTPIASEQGSLQVSGTEKTAATLDVLSLESDDGSTVLRWRLSTPAEVNLNGPQLSVGRANGSTSASTLVSQQTNQRLSLGEYVQVGFTACTCSDLPYASGPAGVDLSAVFGPLDPGATQLQLDVPGFTPLTVPVTRR